MCVCVAFSVSIVNWKRLLHITNLSTFLLIVTKRNEKKNEIRIDFIACCKAKWNRRREREKGVKGRDCGCAHTMTELMFSESSHKIRLFHVPYVYFSFSFFFHYYYFAFSYFVFASFILLAQTLIIISLKVIFDKSLLIHQHKHKRQLQILYLVCILCECACNKKKSNNKTLKEHNIRCQFIVNFNCNLFGS